MKLDHRDVQQRLVRAGVRRTALADSGTTIYRAVHLTETNGAFTLERVADVGVLSLYHEFSAEQEAELAAVCAEVLGLGTVYLKRRPSEARHVANTERQVLAPAAPVWGEVRDVVIAHEQGVPLVIRPGADLSIGLFSDMRPARGWLRAHAGPSVLNTFSYTCAFGLMAAMGGAQSVKNLDASRKVLAWGQENYALSGLPCPDQDFIYGDVFDWLTRFAKRGTVFEQVVLDPPTFARGTRGTWSAEKDYPRLAALAARVTGRGGQIVACTNHAKVSSDVFERMVRAGIADTGRRSRVAERLGAGEDYPDAAHLKVLVVQLDA